LPVSREPRRRHRRRVLLAHSDAAVGETASLLDLTRAEAEILTHLPPRRRPLALAEHVALVRHLVPPASDAFDTDAEMSATARVAREPGDERVGDALKSGSLARIASSLAESSSSGDRRLCRRARRPRIESAAGRCALAAGRDRSRHTPAARSITIPRSVSSRKPPAGISPRHGDRHRPPPNRRMIPPRTTRRQRDGRQRVWQSIRSTPQFSASCDYDPALWEPGRPSRYRRRTDWEPWTTYEIGAECPCPPAAVSWAGRERHGDDRHRPALRRCAPLPVGRAH